MKKLLIGLVTIIVVVIAGLKIAEQVVMGGDIYYTQVTTEGERKEDRDDTGRTFLKFDYSLPGFDKDGNEKQLEFSAIKDRPLRKDAYLKVTWNKNKGVTSYEEVKKPEIPQAAQLKLN